ncbi:LysE family transporter [Vallitalea pronyensis]|uniref:LysE family transporter n=1 Tax=Vallitalea pronyensis TaxID=1348613 RepID=A0A8J8SHN3_9FIRM|nr:LysE family transporter [Vallitalea pronyensis]QUI23756.1 LysE family transporter [Vallitalea pronyensis]
MPSIANFLSYVFLTTFTPGPNNIMSMSNASRYGLKRSIRFNLGIFTGFFIIIVMCNIFSVTLYQVIPSVKPLMTYIGAGYILMLAWKTFKSKPGKKGTINTYTDTFQSGLLLQFVNPKVILYGITIVSTFIAPYYHAPMILGGFSLFLAFISFVSTCSWALFGSLFQSFLSHHYKIINLVMALLLVYCAVSLFF